MVDYIRDEEEQAELLKSWWQQNGTAAIVTVVLAVSGLLGWREWQSHQADTTAQASALYQDMLSAFSAQPVNETVVAQTAAQLQEEHSGSVYADYAQLAQAALAVRSGDFDTAVAHLKPVAEDAASDELGYTAQLRLARVYLEQANYEAASSLLIASYPAAFQGMALTLRADLAKAQGNTEEAIALYAQAIEELADGGERERVQMKLDDLKTR